MCSFELECTRQVVSSKDEDQLWTWCLCRQCCSVQSLFPIAKNRNNILLNHTLGSKGGRFILSTATGISVQIWFTHWKWTCCSKPQKSATFFHPTIGQFPFTEPYDSQRSMQRMKLFEGEEQKWAIPYCLPKFTDHTHTLQQIVSTLAQSTYTFTTAPERAHPLRIPLRCGWIDCSHRSNYAGPIPQHMAQLEIIVGTNGR